MTASYYVHKYHQIDVNQSFEINLNVLFVSFVTVSLITMRINEFDIHLLHRYQHRF